MRTDEVRALLSTAQVARRLGVTPVRVQQLRRRGRLRGVETALGYLFAPSEVAALELERAERRAAS